MRAALVNRMCPIGRVGLIRQQGENWLGRGIAEQFGDQLRLVVAGEGFMLDAEDGVNLSFGCFNDSHGSP